MNLSTPLLLCCTLAAVADPPADKKDAADRYAVRLAAATAIAEPADKAKALLTIAVEAAQTGQDEAVKKCMAAYPKEITLASNDNGLGNLTTELAGAGYEAEALTAAKAMNPPYRDLALGQIAAGSTIGVAAFWRACENGKDDRVEKLCDATTLNAKDKDGETGLMKAAAKGNVAVVKKLLAQEKIEVWETDAKGQTALMKAAANGRDAVVRLLLVYYADKAYPNDGPLNVADAKGQTALILAAAAGHANIVQVLLNARYKSDGNDPLGQKHFLTIEPDPFTPPLPNPFDARLVDREHKDNDDKTALDLAEANKHAGVIELLKKAGQ